MDAPVAFIPKLPKLPHPNSKHFLLYRKGGLFTILLASSYLSVFQSWPETVLGPLTTSLSHPFQVCGAHQAKNFGKVIHTTVLEGPSS